MKKITIGLMALFASLGPSVSVLAGPGDIYQGSHMWEGGWHGWFFGPLMMIVFVAITVAVVVLIVRWLGGSGHGPAHAQPSSGGRSPLEILRERFARGEIDKQEFEERRQILE